MKTFHLSLDKCGDDIPQHDPDGNDIQMHEASNGDLIISFSDKWLEESDWQAGDVLRFEINEDAGSSQIINTTYEERKKAASDQSV